MLSVSRVATERQNELARGCGRLRRFLLPEILEPRRRQFGVADRVLDCAMAEPILDGPRVVSGVRQGVAAAVAEHVGMHREIEASALANAFYQAIDGVRRERAAALGRKHKAAVRELPAKLAQGPDFVAAERVNARACRS